MPIVEDHDIMKININGLMKEVPEQAQNISICLSRIAKLNKTHGEKDDKIASLNKLVSTLFNEVTNILGRDGDEEDALEQLKNKVESNTDKLAKVEEGMERSSAEVESMAELEKLRASGIGLSRQGGLKNFIHEQTELNKQQNEKIEQLQKFIDQIRAPGSEHGLLDDQTDGVAIGGVAS